MVRQPLLELPSLDTHASIQKGAVTFRARLIPGCDWEIVARCPKGRVDFIEGFKNGDDAEAWISSNESLKWIKAEGYH